MYQQKVGYGVVEGEAVKAIANPFESNEISYSRDECQLNDVTLLAPCKPSKVVAVGLNYKDHAKELNMEPPFEPILFMKPTTSIIGPNQEIKYPKQSKEVDYEAELAIVMKKVAKDISTKEASDYVLGYTCSNDVTARDLQRIDGQWTRAKSFNTFCPLGPWIETEVNPDDLGIKLLLNGQVKQNSKTNQMIFSCSELVSFISGVMTLLPGDVILTGTPPGVGPMQPNDKVEVEVEGLGKLTNVVT